MNSVSSECGELKRQYDSCFNSWFVDKFLKGEKNDSCAALFKLYQDCVKKAIQEQKIELWEIEQDILGTEKEKKAKSERGDKNS
ncbi:TP53-regulated inhibitor of apoptosis 1-like [Centruroides sculpturatus]|uniref:TP53-regulated inhibitor of apoptosis 1-like n=1 Tax=Centruroides sculpturatus TaxID=218467 RepID=UPI000C6E62A4|nr:TP53-regulated inhibitor of apoptosis 1-like [Centruroides sculpturatus]